jgi:formylglycine-generating enzyme required for sulfatase activity
MNKVFAAAAALALLGLGIAAQAAITIDTVAVGNKGNTADTRLMDDGTTGYGSVGYNYNIGKYEVTAGQYTAFLDAVAATDTYGLYNTEMDSVNNSYGCNIKRSGNSGSYTYSVASDWANRPVNYVSYWDSCRFANWLGNGQGTGSTETGAYTLTPDGIANNTKSNTTPGRDMADASGNNANYNAGSYLIGSPYYRTEVGEFQNSDSPYGTFDQGGNVYEWNEAIISGACRGLRGGSFSSYYSTLRAPYRYCYYPTYEFFYVGFRVSEVPEPSSIIALAGGLVGLLGIRRRRA